MRVAFIYNLATEDLLRERPERTLRDCDPIETIEEVQAALEAGGHSVIPLNADQRLPARLVELRAQFDIVFNIATGVYGESRQTHVPAMCEYLRIPHTGSGVLAEAICHHKPPTKIMLLAHGVPTPPFQVFQRADEALNPQLGFPLIVKLPSEGASMGLDYGSVVHTEGDLRRRLALLIEKYHQGAMAEAYIDGREFTVGVLGNHPPYTLPIGEIQFFGQLPIRLDQIDASSFDLLRQVTGQDLELVEMESRTTAPARLSPEVCRQIEAAAIAAYQAVGCQDWARVDLRMDPNGRIYVLELNLEPGVASDCALMICAAAAGWSHARLVNTILDHAVERYPHLRGEPAASVPLSLETPGYLKVRSS